jgi:putative nucleotidyltransferase with HDIG domain
MPFRRAASLVMAIPFLLASQRTGFTPEQMRARAWDALRAHEQHEDKLNHALGVEAMMREMATAKTDDPNEWGLAGLLHDIDLPETSRGLARHGIVGAQMLRGLGFSAAIVHAVEAHDDETGIARESRLDHGLYCADQLYWLIHDTGLLFPSEGIATANPAVVWRQAEAKRGSAIRSGKTADDCSRIGLSMPEAVRTALEGLRKAAPAAIGKRGSARENAPIRTRSAGLIGDEFCWR